MIVISKTHNSELYRLQLDNTLPVVNYNNNNVSTVYKMKGDYRFISDTTVVNGSTNTTRTRRFDKDWTNETLMSFFNGMLIADIEYWDNKYYFLQWTGYSSGANLHICNSELTEVEKTVSLSHPASELFKYKDKWFIFDGEYFKLYMYNSDSNQHITTPIEKIFHSGNPDYMNFGNTNGQTSPCWRINYNTGELIAITYENSNVYYGRYNLNNMVNKEYPYLIKRYSSGEGEIPFNWGYNFEILNGHYFMPIKDNFIMEGYCIYDFNFNKIAQIKTKNITAKTIYHSPKEMIVFPRVDYMMSDTPINVYKII